MKKLIFIIIALLVVIAISYLVAYLPGANNDDQVFCTQDALLCYDGSFVGRSGPDCAFSPCPNRDAITGILEQTPDGLRLVVVAPSEAIGVSYFIPLQVNITNAIADLVGERVVVRGEFETGNVLKVENIEAMVGDLSDLTIGEVSVGQSVFINGLKITLNQVVQDSRCPVDAQCIEAGAITANITLQSDNQTETRNFPSDEVPYAFDSHRVSIEKIAPPRVSGSEPNPSSYMIRFRVVKI